MTSRQSCGLGTRAARYTFSGDLSEKEITRWFGVPVTTVARTLVDLARHDRRDGLMAADAALRARLTVPAQIAHVVDRAAGWPGIPQARDVLALADPLSESALESLTRLILHDDGFLAPRLQRWIGEYRVDFCWPEQRLVVGLFSGWPATRAQLRSCF